MILAAMRAAAALVTLIAVAVQFAAAARTPQFNAANFFGYFTVLSNIFAAAVLLWNAMLRGRPSYALDIARGAATTCMVVVGIVFSVLLANLESDMLAWVNVVLHYVMPIVLAADWFADPPRHRLSFGVASLWLAFPLIYLLYTLVRGAIVHWYPYPFLDVERAGTSNVLAAVFGIFVLGLIVSLGLALAGNLRRKPRM